VWTHLHFIARFLSVLRQSFYNVFKLLGFVPGLEFKVAMQEAKKRNIPVVYGDQDSSVPTAICIN
jgi:pheromone shutdown protein TraB